MAVATTANPLSMAGESIDDSDSSETGLLLHHTSPQQPPEARRGLPPAATAMSNGSSPSSPANGLLSLRVKTMDAKEHLVEIAPSASVAELKASIAKALGAEGKFLRLIMQGKMLTPDIALLNTFRIANNAFIHCVISDHQPMPSPHIGIDLENPEYPDVDDDPATRRGFDRLRSHGFTIQEVAAIRSYFTTQVQTYANRQPPREGESTEERQSRMEEEWMERQTETSEFSLNTNRVMATRAVYRTRLGTAGGEGGGRVIEHGAGTGRDFMWGFVMGSCLGFISLFWLWNVPMSHQQKMGIVAGVSCQLGWNIVRRQTFGET